MRHILWVVLQNARRRGKWFRSKAAVENSAFPLPKITPSGVPLGLFRRKAEQTQNKTQQRRKKACLALLLGFIPFRYAVNIPARTKQPLIYFETLYIIKEIPSSVKPSTSFSPFCSCKPPFLMQLEQHRSLIFSQNTHPTTNIAFHAKSILPTFPA